MSSLTNLPTFRNIPQELIARDQWVLWHLEGRNKAKPTKVPYTVRGTLASSTNPKLWASFQAVCAAYDAAQGRYSGIGFVLAEDDPFVGVDLDHCIHDGAADEWARAIVDRLDSYTEVTPSGEGLRVFVKGQLPEGGRKRGNFEIYSSGRYLTITGNHLEGAPWEILERQGEVEAVHRQVFGQTQGHHSHHSVVEPPNPQPRDFHVDPHIQAPITRIAALLENCPGFAKVWERRRSFTSQSEYDLSLVNWGVRADFTNQEIVAMVVLHRYTHGESIEKAMRSDYWTNSKYGLFTKVARW